MIKKINEKLLMLFFLGINLVFLACSKSDDGGGNQGGDPDPDPDPVALELSKTVPIGVNSWVTNGIQEDETVISDSGIHNWSELSHVIKSFVYTGSGKLNVGFNMKSGGGTSKISVKVGSETKEIEVSNSNYEVVEVGTFDVSAGYNVIEIQGLEKSGSFIGDINDLRVGGSATTAGIKFVPLSNNHFGRRGPSVHMGYTPPSGVDVKYFYNEVTVAEGDDVTGSFFMTAGHGEGYFGIQVNSNGQRRVLFSIWSAFVTDDPNQIPEDYKVTNLGNGEGVTVQDFGNEGSGKQSFKDIGWKTDVTYKFLLKGEPSPDVAESTDYTGYFFDPEVGEWQLIASLRRPKTSKYLTNTHSFLENFHESTGHIERQVEFGNQWAYTAGNVWSEMTNANFTNDATASREERLDYAGGTNGDKFFLRNCGFFNDNVAPNTGFTRAASGVAPVIDFASLPVPMIVEPEPVVLVNRANWSIADFSSEEAVGEDAENNGLASDVLDDDLATYWHSCWNGDCGAAEYPHYLTIDMGAMTDLEGLQFIQRNGARKVENLTVEISSDNTSWTSLGSFDLADSSEPQNTDFGTMQTTRYIRITMNSSLDGERFAAMAEIKAYIKE